jgi:hypothetical protein
MELSNTLYVIIFINSCTCIYVYIYNRYTYIYKFMYCTYIVYTYIYGKQNRTNGKRQLLFVCCEQKQKAESCFPWSENVNGNRHLLVKQTCLSLLIP